MNGSAGCEIAGAPRAKVLVVDDEELVRHSIARILSRGHDVQSVGEGERALDLIRGGARFDAILCDLMMPGMTGIELHRALAQAAPDQARRTAFVTGGAVSAEAQRLLDGLERPVIEKPFTRDELVACVRLLARAGA